MNREIRIKQTTEQKVYFTSDLHLNHKRDFVYEARGYDTSEDHTSSVIDRINEVVRPNDILFHLGDFCLNSDTVQAESLLNRIQCQHIYMLFGNHNNPLWKMYLRAVREWVNWNEDGGPPGACELSFNKNEPPLVEVYPFRYKNVLFLGNYLEALIDDHMFIMSHYPIYVFNYMKDGAMHLTGHSHYALDFSQATNLGSKILDVGWDGFAKPLSVKEVLEIMDKKKVFETTDHHKKKEASVETQNPSP